jgi:leucyl-tRNA synthetase
MQKKDFPFKQIDEKWHTKWEEEGLFRVGVDHSKKKFYILDMFPYPSAAGLHVGHPEGYTASDIVARYKMMQGFQVLHPMGWDAFGLPTENYAIQKKIHPEIATKDNIQNFKRQISRFGFSYDWSREITTSDPSYYKWTQWIFIKLFEHGLAYEKEAPINWCPSCKTGLANEEVVNGKCDRCGAIIERKYLRQWMLRITAYAQRLLDDLDIVDWPQDVKAMQTNWIGKSYGATVFFPIVGTDEKVEIYTTRPDTIFGATYMVLSPEHPLLDQLVTGEYKKKVMEYRDSIQSKSDLERTELNKDKTGIHTGLYCQNPMTGDNIPVYAADYVLMSYGTGAIMAVPAHDQRDFDFAQKYHLPIIPVIEPSDMDMPTDKAFDLPGKMIHSGSFNGMPSEEAKKLIVQSMEERHIGEASTQYRLRDWIFSRQRFWGEPIPIVHCEKCGCVPVPEDQLPLTLPKVEFYEPSGTGESPLVEIKDWVQTTCPTCGGPAKRETNTMPQWAGSSWYYIRYVDPSCQKGLASEEALQYWLPVDTYIGGKEHTNLHLLYVRFWHKFLQDIGIVHCPEPFVKLRNQGMVLAEDGRKMSKSLGNVINPDEVLDLYGADVIRMYEMFMGPFEQESLWNTQGVEGIKRFINKVWSLATEGTIRNEEASDETLRQMHKTIKKVTEDIDDFSFNTAISSLMIFVNHMQKLSTLPAVSMKTLYQLLAPFAPHICEELWQQMGNKDSIFQSSWPPFLDEYCEDPEIEIAIQINGKVRDKIVVPSDIDENSLKERIVQREKVQDYTKDKTIQKWIVVPSRLVNIIVKP